MLAVNRSVHLEWKVEVEEVSINTLLPVLRQLQQQSVQGVQAQLLEEAQQAHVARVLAGEAAWGCTGCGLLHCGAQSFVCRGWRRRKLKTLDGILCFRLRQLSCRVCGRTQSPYAALLGIEPRQRVLAEVVERLVGGVLLQSYARTCTLAREWMGVSLSAHTLHRQVQEKGAAVRFTSGSETAPLLADGTKCPIGKKTQGEEVRLAFQVVGRTQQGGRRRAELRVVGLGVGAGSWAEALPKGLRPELVVTDQEPALAAYVRKRYPQARHQLCEWHLVHTLYWSLHEDKIKAARKRKISALLERILFCAKGTRWKRRHYARLLGVLKRISPTAHAQLSNAQELILYPTPSAERTTSLVERQMREVNRRMENGSNWSEPGARNLLRLRLAKRHNPDDYARVWMLN